jgi:hypothetical protein
MIYESREGLLIKGLRNEVMSLRKQLEESREAIYKLVDSYDPTAVTRAALAGMELQKRL